MLDNSKKPMLLRSSILFLVAVWSALCYGAEPSSTGFYIVLPEASVGSHYFDSDAYPKLGYIANRPDLPISRLESVQTPETCGLHVTYSNPDDDTSRLIVADSQCVEIKLYPPEAQVFENLTTLNLGRQMLLLVDGQAICAPNIRMPISGGSFLIAMSEHSDASGIKRKLNSLVGHP